jgi:hypothetical protein
MGAGTSSFDDIGGRSIQLPIIGLKVRVGSAAESQEYSESPLIQLRADLLCK